MTSLHEVATPPRPTISTTELRDRLGDPNLTIVDVRPLAAYNGWRLNGETRGGHIPGAVAFPSDWLTSVDAPEIASHPRREGHRPGSRRRRLRRCAARRRRPSPPAWQRWASRTSASMPTAFAAWAADPTLPIERLPEVRQARPRRLAAPGPRGRAPRGRAGRQVPALPRELRRARGVRGGPHPRRPLPRHELARGPRRLEPPFARGHRRRPRALWASPTTRPSSSTAATRKATPTRSGPAGARARSPRPGR